MFTEKYGDPLKTNYQNVILRMGIIFYMFAIKICSSADHDKIIGHLSREISVATKFLIDRSATITETVRSKNGRRPPLFQWDWRSCIRSKLLCLKHEESI